MSTSQTTGNPNFAIKALEKYLDIASKSIPIKELDAAERALTLTIQIIQEIGHLSVRTGLYSLFGARHFCIMGELLIAKGESEINIRATFNKAIFLLGWAAEDNESPFSAIYWTTLLATQTRIRRNLTELTVEERKIRSQ